MCVCVFCAGLVSLLSPLSALGSNSVRLAVSAHDGQGVSALLPADILINVLQTDHTPALFHKSHYSFSVLEDAPVGTVVGTVQAVRPPSESSSHLPCYCTCYSLYL